MKFALCAGLLLASTTAFAQAGLGRVSLHAGYRYTPNDFFLNSARGQGYLVRQSPGGPQFTGTFAYAATDSLELAIDLFAGYEALRVEGYDSIQSVSYGALVGGRLFHRFGAFTPNLGIGIGPTLVNVSGGPLGVPNERVITGYAAVGGVNYRLGDTFGLGLDVRVLLGRGRLSEVGGINAGGIWAGLGATWFIPPDVSRDSTIR